MQTEINTDTFQNADPDPSGFLDIISCSVSCSTPMSGNRYLNIFLLAVRNDKMWELQCKTKITLFIYN